MYLRLNDGKVYVVDFSMLMLLRISWLVVFVKKWLGCWLCVC